MGHSAVEALQQGREDALGLWPTCSMMVLSVSGIRLLLTCRSAASQHMTHTLSQPLTGPKLQGTHTASAPARKGAPPGRAANGVDLEAHKPA